MVTITWAYTRPSGNEGPGKLRKWKEEDIRKVEPKES